MVDFGTHDGVRIERDGALLRVTLANPQARNAQSPATWRRLAAIPDLLTPDVRAVILSGEGVSFSAGLDRRMLTPEGIPGKESLLSLATYDGPQMEDFIRAAQETFT